MATVASTPPFTRSEIANLKITAAVFLAPRLRALAETTKSYPADTTFEAWQSELNQMARALELVISHPETPDEVAEHNAGLELLGRRFQHLWS
ncbi:hypothetical protein CKO28_02745 [Rhodovibrio sodomensis]|uniref:Uncharacterized protein n=1 Tax=Rhodovibrio sodomensis TaxID=1088 RepID=A0ABS1D977_9PROT|nr:hypothetical protein [Rhodovibrio sodomensis]MBK1666961.1 hypothetical protein [Rhodovibrio sodomensis]